MIMKRGLMMLLAAVFSPPWRSPPVPLSTSGQAQSSR